MRILYIASGFQGLTPASYGIGTAVRNASVGMAARGHDIRVVIPSYRGKISTVDGVVCHEFVPEDPDPGEGNPYRRNLSIVRANADQHLAEIYQCWYEYVNRFNAGFVPDIVDCQDWRALGYFYSHHRLLGYEEAAAPMLTFCHSGSKIQVEADQQLTYSWHNFLLGRRELYQMAASDALASPSNYMSNLIHTRYHLPRPQVCCYTLDLAKPGSILPPCDNNELLFFGQIRYFKGVLDLLKVCGYLWDEGHRFVLKLAGQSTLYVAKAVDMSDFIKTQYKRYIDRGFLKVLPHSEGFLDIKEQLAESRAVVHPSLMEPLGLTCVEAMSCGRAVVASSSGGHAEVIEHRRSGFIFHTLDELETCIKRVLLATRMELEEWGASANERACAMFSPEKTLPARERLYEQIIHDGRRNLRGAFPSCSFLDKGKFPTLPEQAHHQESIQPYVKGLLSVVVPCYNLGRFLPETLESIYKSTYRPIELIVIDDASDDRETTAVLNEVEASRADEDGFCWRVLRGTRNKGLTAVRNLGAEVARGEFICFVDADDRVEPEYFQKAIGIMNRYANVGFVGGWAELFGSRSDHWVVLNFDLPFTLVINQQLQASVMRHSAYEKQKLSIVAQDWEGWLSVAEKGWVGVNLPEPILHYRIRHDSQLHSTSPKELLLAYQEVSMYHPGLLRAFGDDLYVFMCQNYLHTFLDGPEEHLNRLQQSAMSLLRHYWGRPSDLWKMPYLLGRVVLSQRAQQKMRKLLGIPPDRTFAAHMTEKLRWRKP